MAAAIIGLIGVLLGALMTQLGTILIERRQSRAEAGRWRRDQKAAAYDSALQNLLRVANRRSRLTVASGPVIALEDVRQILDDLVEAQFWVRALATRCGPAQVERITTATETASASKLGKPAPITITRDDLVDPDATDEEPA